MLVGLAQGKLFVAMFAAVYLEMKMNLILSYFTELIHMVRTHIDHIVSRYIVI
jgi:hypothetical protein